MLATKLNQQLQNLIVSQIIQEQKKSKSEIREEDIQDYLNLIFLKIESIILEQDNIKNCVILLKDNQFNQQELVAYIVPFSNSVSEENLEKSLQGLIFSPLIPKFFVTINQIPLTKTGEVDSEKLAQLEVIDSQLIAHWEEKLKSHNYFKQVAVVVKNNHNPERRIHLKDLIIEPENTIENQKLKSISPEELIVNNSKPKSLAIVKEKDLFEFPLQQFQSLSELLEKNTQKYPQQEIIYVQNDGYAHTKSYLQLLEEAQKILTGLKKLGLQPQDKVIFQLDYNEDILPAFWGCILGGFIAIISEIPPNWAEKSNLVDKICYIYEFLDQPLIITRQAYSQPIKSLSQWLGGKDVKIVTIETLRDSEKTRDYYHSNPDEIAFFNFTSGSTGKPKCIPLTHHNLITRAQATNQLCQHNNHDIILNWLPFDHIGSIADWHIRPLLTGCKLVYAAKEYIVGNPLNWLNLMDEYRITHSWAPNFAYCLINEALEKEKQQKWNLSGVKTLLTAGESISYAAITDFIQKLTPYGLKASAIKSAFGMAETSSGITYYQPNITEVEPFLTIDKASLKDVVKPVTPNHPHSVTFANLGCIIPSMSMRIVDKHNSVLPENRVGLLQVKGDAVFQGYYHKPEVNQEVFTEDGWFNTGDLGFITQGNLIITGRAKETIIINGVNYYSHEIETFIEEIKGLEVSYTAACSIKIANELNEQLAIFFNPSFFEEDFLIKLISKIKNKLGNKIGIIPSYFIPLSKQEIPKTAIGKIQRTRLKNRFESGKFEGIKKKIDLLLENEKTIPNWFYKKKWRPSQGKSNLKKISFGRTLIFVDELELGNCLAQKLESTQGKCIQVKQGVDFKKLDDDYYQLNPINPQHYQLLLESILNYGIPIAQIVHCWNYKADIEDIKSLEQLESFQNQILTSILFLVQNLAEFQPEQPVELFVVGNYTQVTNCQDKIAIEKASLLGLLKTIPQEMPWLNCRHIDLSEESTATNRDYLMQEISLLSKDREVAYRQGMRLIPRLEKVDWQEKYPPKLPFKKESIYLITGGLGGIGVEIAKYLLKNYQAKVILVGRTNLPERSQWGNYRQKENKLRAKIEAYEKLEKLKGEIAYYAADICNLEQLKLVWQKVKSKWSQPITGVINLAGVYRENWLTQENINDFMEAMRPKVLGSWVINELAKNEKECEIIHFSSIASFFGGAKLSSYAAANAFLEAFSCYQNQQQSGKSYCYSWSGWQEIGMNKNSASEYLTKARGYYSISVAQGINSLLAGLSNSQTHLFIGLDGFHPHISSSLEVEKPNLTKQLVAYYTTENNHQQDIYNLAKIEICDHEVAGLPDCFGIPSNCQLVKIEQMPLTKEGKIDRQKLIGNISFQEFGQIVAPRNDLEKEIAKIWQDILKLEKPIGVYDNFFELGGDSVKATMLINKVKQEIGGDLSVANLFEMPTINQLALSLSNINFKEKISDEDLLAEVLAEVNQLSDQEITHKLREIQ